MILRCNACGGTYTNPLPDTMLYFHACSPLTVWELRAAIAAGKSPLTPAQSNALTAADAPNAVPGRPPGSLPTGDAYLSTLTIARPNARDENVTRAADGIGWTMKAAGAGVTEIGP